MPLWSLLSVQWPCWSGEPGLLMNEADADTHDLKFSQFKLIVEQFGLLKIPELYL